MLRREAARRHEVPKYDNHCRGLSDEEVKKRLENGENYVVRFKLQRKEVFFKVMTFNFFQNFVFPGITYYTILKTIFSNPKNIIYSVSSFLFSLNKDFKDQIFGEITQKSDEGDFILMKTDLFPTYHLANVVDDHQMRISHVIRGSEWLTSVSKHMQLYQ